MIQCEMCKGTGQCCNTCGNTNKETLPWAIKMNWRVPWCPACWDTGRGSLCEECDGFGDLEVTQKVRADLCENRG